MDSIQHWLVPQLTSLALVLALHTATATIIKEPENTFAIAGENVGLSVECGEDQTIFQWQRSGTNLPGATSATLMFNNITLAQAGDYRVIVGYGVTSETSRVAVVRVGYPFVELFNTGVDDRGIPLPGATADAHWMVLESADVGYPNPATYTYSWGPPHWFTNGTASRWLSPWDGSQLTEGVYVYRTRFLLTDLDPANAELSGRWLADGRGTEIRLNGVPVLSGTLATPLAFSGFVITHGFVAGENTLDFVTYNGGSGDDGWLTPGGIRVELRGVALRLPPAAPMLTTLPVNVITQAQQTAELRIAATGAAPLRFQWHHDGTPLLGRTNRVLRLSPLAAQASGSYSVIVSNALGTTNATAEVVVVPTATLAWSATESSTWAAGVSNFVNLATGEAVEFTPGAMVVFDDSGGSLVTFFEKVQPSAIVFNSAQDHLWHSCGFSTCGGISGPSSLLKSNTGILALNTINTFTGPTIVEAGVLQVGGVESGTLSQGPVVNHATLEFTGYDVKPQVIANAISGRGDLVISRNAAGGSGVVLLASNSYSGSTFVSSQSELIVRNPMALGTPSGSTQVAAGGWFVIDANIDLAEPLIFASEQWGGARSKLKKSGGGLTALRGSLNFLETSEVFVETSSILEFAGSVSLQGGQPSLVLDVSSNALVVLSGKVSSTGEFRKLGGGNLVLAGEIAALPALIAEDGKLLTPGNVTNCGVLGLGARCSLELSNSVVNAGISLYSDAASGSYPSLLAACGSNVCLGDINVAAEAGKQPGRVELNAGGPQSELHILGKINSDYGQVVLTGSGGSGYIRDVEWPEAIVITGTSAWEVRSSTLDLYVTVKHESGTLRAASDLFFSKSLVMGAAGQTAILDLNGCDVATASIASAGGTQVIANSSKSADATVTVFTDLPGSSAHQVYTGTLCDSVNGGTRRTGLSIDGTGLGSLTLSNVCTYTGETSIRFGTLRLAGSGAIPNSATITLRGFLDATRRADGGFTVAPGQTLRGDPDLEVQPFNILGRLKLEGMLKMDVIKTTKGVQTDWVEGPSQVTLGGTLELNITGNPLAAGDALKLFPAGVCSGEFGSILPKQPGPGLLWDTSLLASQGTLRVVSGGATNPSLSLALLGNGNTLHLSWPAGAGWLLQAQTNPAGTGLGSNWFPVVATLITNQVFFPVLKTTESVFYRLVPNTP